MAPYSSPLDPAEYLEAIGAGLLAAAIVSFVVDELQTSESPGSVYVPDQAVLQAQVGGEVTIPRPYGPDLEVRAVENDTKQEDPA